MRYILAIDQGTTSSRAIIFDENQQPIGHAQQEFQQYFPRSGWVEHNPEEIWTTVLNSIKGAMDTADIKPNNIAAIGITNQRETIVVWDRESGQPIHNAIVWQDRRTADTCAKLKQAGYEPLFTKKTGLLLDPYFSATKLAWILDHVDGARSAADAGRLAFGTIDTFLIWRLTGGKAHVTDATNAARTLLFNIHEQIWDRELLEHLNIPESLLPQALDCAAEFGVCDARLFGAAAPICGVAGDQQAATLGQACFEEGMLKSTYGTGCFALLNTGATPVISQNRLLTTIAYRLNGAVTYALEGSIFIAGAAVQWLRDGLRILDDASQSGLMAENADPHQAVYLVPAFTGMGAPYWDAEARGAIFGLTRNSGPNELARAALEAVCYQTRDLLEAMRKDWPVQAKTVLRVDGGMVASDWTMQFLADILSAPVDRPKILETTALGAAWLAGHYVGLWSNQAEFAKRWQLQRTFYPQMDEASRADKYRGWQDAVSRTLSHATFEHK